FGDSAWDQDRAAPRGARLRTRLSRSRLVHSRNGIHGSARYLARTRRSRLGGAYFMARLDRAHRFDCDHAELARGPRYDSAGSTQESREDLNGISRFEAIHLTERCQDLAAHLEGDWCDDQQRIEARIVASAESFDERGGAREVHHVGRKYHGEVVQRFKHLIRQQLTLDELDPLLCGGALERDAEQRFH